jgi:hypothetical protein
MRDIKQGFQELEIFRDLGIWIVPFCRWTARGQGLPLHLQLKY